VTSYLVPFRSDCSLLFKFWILCVFEPPFGGLGTTYDAHLWLFRKRVVDFLLVLIERAKRDRKSAISLQRGQFDPKFQVKGSPPPIIFAPIVKPMNTLQL